MATKRAPMTERVKALKGLPAIRGNVGTVTMIRPSHLRTGEDKDRKDRDGNPKPETRVKHLRPGETPESATVLNWIAAREAEGYTVK